jgi:hypothetical protein
MKCPHCNTGIHENFEEKVIVHSPNVIDRGPQLIWTFHHQRCPECLKSIILLELRL